MKRSIFTSWSLIWLLATIFFVAGGALNLSQRATHQLPPTDGVLWVEKADGIYAERVERGFAASRAGISPGDKLLSISLDGTNFDEVVAAADVPMYLDAAGVGGSLTYFFEKSSFSFADNRYFADLRNIDTVPRWPASLIFLMVVGVVWLGVGVFVLFKQGSQAPFILHFATVCLAAFVFHFYSALGFGQDFDLAIQVVDWLAFIAFAPLFVHFCLRYPVRSEVFDEARWKTIATYAPAVAIAAAVIVLTFSPFVLPTATAISFNAALASYKAFPLLNAILVGHFAVGVAIGAGILLWRFLTSTQAVVRQRLKWAMWGTIASVIPIIGLQLTRQFIYLPEDIITSALSTLPLALIPLSFGHSVVRYRLMDVDVVVRRALVYAMTTLAIAMMIGAVALGLVFLAVGSDLSTTEITLRAVIAIVAMAAIVMLSEPLKNFLQERANRFFYGERYDLRRGLLDFGRTLSASTALEPLLESLSHRLVEVLDVEKVAVFIEDREGEGGYRIGRSIGLTETYTVPRDFKQIIRQKSAANGIVRADQIEINDDDADTTNGNGGGLTGVRQELHYFVPCVVGSKMVAVIGLGRAKDGSLLSSEDLEILRTISGYIAVAIENSRLYQEQKQQTAELALLKEFNESIVESVNVGLLAVNEDGLITRCNTTFEEMMNRSRSEVIGKSVDDIFDPAFAANLNSILGKSRWHLTEIRNAYKLHARDASGNPLILNVAVAPLRSVSNEQTGGIIVLENVSSRVKLEESLQQSEKLSSIGLLAAGVAHEVNTPLTGVSSYTQMLLGMIPETDPKHELLKKMHRQTERAANIVGNLLNFSRTGSAIEWTEVDVNKLIDDTLQLLEPQLRRSQIEIVKQYEERPPLVSGNSGKLQQVLTNLILNARDAMANGGIITLRTILDGDRVRVEVADTGEGISEEDISKIFDPFFTTKAVGSGTGLGLAVTYGIVQEHGGSIEAKSPNGSGATFILTLPLGSPAQQRMVG
ncbi:MAG: PAS domain S-box protein [Acidobacteria bacterium]|nr:PAS domain S-box protein [Acidobacteriota bacterium]